jgi:hypothetical protein
VVREAVLRAERPADLLRDERWIAKCSEADPEHTRFEVRHELGRRFEREPRLAGAARAAKRQ